jgi:hypothetical protein
VVRSIASWTPLGTKASGDVVILADHGLKAGKWWDFSTVPGPYGERFAWGNQGTEDNPNWQGWVSLPGRFMGAMDIRTQYRFFWFLAAGVKDSPDSIPWWSFKCNRLDVALDDFSRRVSPKQIDDVLAQYPGVLASGKSHSGVYSTDDEGNRHYTIYCGSKKSDSFLRVYDALPVHGEDAIRFESQFRRRIAHHAFALLLGADYPKFADGAEISDILQRRAASLVTGSVDFRYPQEGVRLERRERVPFWQSLCEDIELSMKPSRVKPVNSFQEKLEWFEYGMGKLLYKLRSVLGPTRFSAYLEYLLGRAVDRIDDFDERQIALWRLEFSGEFVHPVAEVAVPAFL